MEKVKRIFVEKKAGFDVEANGVYEDLKANLAIDGLIGVRVINRYDISGMTDEEYEKARGLIFSEPPVDNAYDETIDINDEGRVFAVEFLPGQFDQRAASAGECVSILTGKESPIIRSAKVYVLKGKITDEEFNKIKKYIINPVEAREAELEKPESLEMEVTVPDDVKVIEGFIEMDDASLSQMLDEYGFAMDLDDLRFCRDYFVSEKRNPTMTELRMIDTYWSDHCRHTTFSTKINNVLIHDGKYSDVIKEAYDEYLKNKAELYSADRDVCLMNMATIIVKQLKKKGLLNEIDVSEEINACSIVVPVDIDGVTEDWLIMFKNETHNHPTEIEPFGGAATCLGGAIRDPLSGRSYVYQAMRVTGSADPRATLEETLPGKLMQRKITKGAASGYSSYGNQIGLATGQVQEIYHPGYAAKRMEIGAVIGAAPKKNVIRETPAKGDIIVLLGGKTGRDGCGGATGSSKAHTETSIKTCGSEVQKGNPPVERKIQRLFRNEAVTTLIKRCNDFGAGGVSVAIGELADGLIINLDKVPKKYEGLDGTELAISESQERMAVVIAASDKDKFIEYANEENLEATVVAEVTDQNRLEMFWRGKKIVDISRDFLNTNGAVKNTDVEVVLPREDKNVFAYEETGNIKDKWIKTLSDLNVCSQKGLSEMFDSTIGANTVTMPFGGKYQLTPTEGMAAKVPTSKETNTATVMTFGYDPYISSWSPFHGSVYAVLESVSKAVAMGADYKKIYLTFQEYFESLGSEPKRWGKPFAALLGAYRVQEELGIASIGGKDSMSGSFNELDVPPTLTSFAVAPVKADAVVSAEFKSADSKVVLFELKRDENDLPVYAEVKKMYEAVNNLVKAGKVKAAAVVKSYGLCETLSKMAFGNMIGLKIDENVTENMLFGHLNGSVVLEVEKATATDGAVTVAYTQESEHIAYKDVNITLSECIKSWKGTLEKVFPTDVEYKHGNIETFSYDKGCTIAGSSFAKPRVFIPVFPGTNCEFDTAKAFEKAGAVADVFVIRNLTGDDVMKSMEIMKKKIDEAQIIMIPGGFSGGDEPDGSGKFIATAFRNPWVKESVNELLKNRDGLMLGICNGFQALIKLGLVPYGEICDLSADSPTLTFNTIGRHVSCMVTTRIATNKSPWLANVNVGDLHTIAVSHGEGRFVASEEMIKQLAANGQIATQYVDFSGNATYDMRYNPNGSVYAIEGITSPDGRVLGKMGHSERIGSNIASNVPGNKDQKLFEAGVQYFK